jgi:hypothetical protein
MMLLVVVTLCFINIFFDFSVNDGPIYEKL